MASSAFRQGGRLCFRDPVILISRSSCRSIGSRSYPDFVLIFRLHHVSCSRSVCSAPRIRVLVVATLFPQASRPHYNTRFNEESGFLSIECNFRLYPFSFAALIHGSCPLSVRLSVSGELPLLRNSEKSPTCSRWREKEAVRRSFRDTGAERRPDRSPPAISIQSRNVTRYTFPFYSSDLMASLSHIPLSGTEYDLPLCM